MIRYFLVAAVTIIFPLLCSAEKGITGKTAPDWKISDWHQLPEGKKSLQPADFRGKVLFLYYFQSW